MKLIRHLVPAAMERQGTRYKTSTADRSEMNAHLRKKLIEEAMEAATAEPKDLCEELADVMEVVIALGEENGLTPADVEVTRRAKAARYGTFEAGVLLHGQTEEVNA